MAAGSGCGTRPTAIRAGCAPGAWCRPRRAGSRAGVRSPAGGSAPPWRWRGTGASVSPVFFGGRLIAKRASRGWSAVELPDGRRGFLAASALAGSRPPGLEERIATLLGTPYLWGGRSPAGYDCSAFVQQVLLEQGVSLPRDAADQCQRSRPVTNEERAGDLAFFRRPGEPASHVGIALGGGYFAHCRGRVVVASVDDDNPLYDKELRPQFMGWFRASKSR